MDGCWMVGWMLDGWTVGESGIKANSAQLSWSLAELGNIQQLSVIFGSSTHSHSVVIFLYNKFVFNITNYHLSVRKYCRPKLSIFHFKLSTLHLLVRKFYETIAMLSSGIIWDLLRLGEISLRHNCQVGVEKFFLSVILADRAVKKPRHTQHNTT